MARGARNKKKQKARTERRKKFAPRVEEKLATHVPDLEKLRENTAAQNRQIEEDNEMGEKKGMTQEEINAYDSKTKRNADGNYAPWLSGRDIKRLKALNKKKKKPPQKKKKKKKKKK